eukprot:CFRG0145T1
MCDYGDDDDPLAEHLRDTDSIVRTGVSMAMELEQIVSRHAARVTAGIDSELELDPIIVPATAAHVSSIANIAQSTFKEDKISSTTETTLPAGSNPISELFGTEERKSIESQILGLGASEEGNAKTFSRENDHNDCKDDMVSSPFMSTQSTIKKVHQTVCTQSELRTSTNGDGEVVEQDYVDNNSDSLQTKSWPGTLSRWSDTARELMTWTVDHICTRSGGNCPTISKFTEYTRKNTQTHTRANAHSPPQSEPSKTCRSTGDINIGDSTQELRLSPIAILLADTHSLLEEDWFLLNSLCLSCSDDIGVRKGEDESIGDGESMNERGYEQNMSERRESIAVESYIQSETKLSDDNQGSEHISTQEDTIDTNKHTHHRPVTYHRKTPSISMQDQHTCNRGFLCKQRCPSTAAGEDKCADTQPTILSCVVSNTPGRIALISLPSLFGLAMCFGYDHIGTGMRKTLGIALKSMSNGKQKVIFGVLAVLLGTLSGSAMLTFLGISTGREMTSCMRTCWCNYEYYDGSKCRHEAPCEHTFARCGHKDIGVSNGVGVSDDTDISKTCESGVTYICAQRTCLEKLLAEAKKYTSLLSQVVRIVSEAHVLHMSGTHRKYRNYHTNNSDLHNPPSQDRTNPQSYTAGMSMRGTKVLLQARSSSVRWASMASELMCLTLSSINSVQLAYRCMCIRVGEIYPTSVDDDLPVNINDLDWEELGIFLPLDCDEVRAGECVPADKEIDEVVSDSNNANMVSGLSESVSVDVAAAKTSEDEQAGATDLGKMDVETLISSIQVHDIVRSHSLRRLGLAILATQVDTNETNDKSKDTRPLTKCCLAQAKSPSHVNADKYRQTESKMEWVKVVEHLALKLKTEVRSLKVLVRRYNSFGAYNDKLSEHKHDARRAKPMLDRGMDIGADNTVLDDYEGNCIRGLDNVQLHRILDALEGVVASSRALFMQAFQSQEALEHIQKPWAIAKVGVSADAGAGNGDGGDENNTNVQQQHTLSVLHRHSMEMNRMQHAVSKLTKLLLEHRRLLNTSVSSLSGPSLQVLHSAERETVVANGADVANSNSSVAMGLEVGEFSLICEDEEISSEDEDRRALRKMSRNERISYMNMKREREDKARLDSQAPRLVISELELVLKNREV